MATGYQIRSHAAQSDVHEGNLHRMNTVNLCNEDGNVITRLMAECDFQNQFFFFCRRSDLAGAILRNQIVFAQMLQERVFSNGLGQIIIA
jgi:hypothetical protein